MKIFLTILLICFGFTSVAETIVVGKDQMISSLKVAVAKARDGDTILLMQGNYLEGNIIITRSIKLIGINSPVLDGENKYEILTLSGNNILVKGIHFKNSGYSSMNDLASIKLIDAQNCTIENNVIYNANFAIHAGNARHCTIVNNSITGIRKSEQMAGNGIHLWKCANMVVKHNDITAHRDGIYFEFVTHSLVLENNSYGNIRYGLHFMFSNNDSYLKNTFKDNGAGVAVMYSHHVLMLGNHFEYNWGPNAYGLLLKEISDATIVQNTFTQNTIAILMEGTNRVNLKLNSFNNNGWAIKIQASCNDNTVHYNNFHGNTFDIGTNGTLMMNRFYNNYWDKYEGYDLNRNGIGDVPYHPVSMYSMVIEQNQNALFLLRSFMVSLLEKAEKAIPSITPEFMIDEKPAMKPLKL